MRNNKTMKKLLLALCMILTSAVFLFASPDQDLILEPEVQAFSAATDPSYPVENIMDGDSSTFWQLRSASQTGWTEIKLAEGANLIYGIEISADIQANASIIIEYLVDGSWKQFSSGRLSEGSLVNEFIDLSYEHAVTDCIRFQVVDPLAVKSRIYEIKLFGESETRISEKLTEFEFTEDERSWVFNNTDNLFDSSVWTEWQTSPYQVSRDLQSNLKKYKKEFSSRSFSADYAQIDDIDKAIEELGMCHSPKHEFSQEHSTQVDFNASVSLQKIMVYIKPYFSGELSITTPGADGEETLLYIGDSFEYGWNEIDIASDIELQTVTITQRGFGFYLKGISEIEFWGTGTAENRNPAVNPYPGVYSGTGEITEIFEIEEAGDYLLDIALRDASRDQIDIEWNGETLTAVLKNSQNDTTLYQLEIPESTLWPDLNILTFSLLTDESYVYADLLKPEENGLVGYIGNDLLCDGLLFNESGGSQEHLLDLKQPALVHSVYVYGDYSGSSKVECFDGNNWIEFSPGLVTDTGSQYSGFAKGQAVRITPNGNNIGEVKIYGSPVEASAPVLLVNWPYNNSVIKTGAVRSSNIFGTVDNPYAKIKIDGKNAYQMGTWYWYPLNKMNIKDPGEYSFTVTADISGTVTEKTVTFMVCDRDNFNFPEEGTTVVTNEPTHVISGWVPHGYKVLIDGKEPSRMMNKVISRVDLDPGINLIPVEVYLKSRGRHGNLVYKFIQRIIYLKHELSLAVTSPAEGSFVESSEISVQGYIYGTGALAVTVNDVEAPVENGFFISAPLALTAGQNILIVKGSDESGESITKEITIYADSEPPVLSNIQPNESSGFITSDNVTISGDFEDLTSVSVWVNGIAAIITDNHFSIDLPFSDGDNTFMVVARDGTGNETTYQGAFTKDTTPPEQFALTITPDSWTNEMPQIYFDAEDETSGIAYYEISVAGTDFIQAESPYTIPYVKEGENSILVKAVDNTGLSTLAQGTAYIDTVAPQDVQYFRGVPASGEITLKWANPEETDGVVSYTIVREPSWDTEEQKTILVQDIEVGLQTFNDSELVNGDKFHYTISANDIAGNSSEISECDNTAGIELELLSDEQKETVVEFDSLNIIVPPLQENDLNVRAILATDIECEELEELAPFGIYGNIISMKVVEEGENGLELMDHTDFEQDLICTWEYDETELPEGFREQNLGVYYYDPMWGRWFLVEKSAVDADNNRIYFRTNHFTSFSVQPTVFEDLSPQEIEDLGNNPFKTEYNHGKVSVSPQAGSASVSVTEFVLPGKDGFEFALNRRYDTAIARMDGRNTMINISINMTPLGIARVVGEAVIYMLSDQVGQFIAKAEDYLEGNGDYSYSMGLGWRLDLPFIRNNNGSIIIRLPDGSCHNLNEYELSGENVDWTSPVSRTLNFQGHEGADYRVEMYQVRADFDLGDISEEIISGILTSAFFDESFSMTWGKLIPCWKAIYTKLYMSDGTEYRFDQHGRLMSITDPSGINTIEIEYQSANRIDYIRDPMGRTLRFEYAAAGMLMPKITRIYYEDDPYGREVTYEQQQFDEVEDSNGDLDSSVPLKGALNSATNTCENGSERTYNYSYERDVLTSGEVGFKVNPLGLYIGLVDPAGVLAELGIAPAGVNLHGNITTEIVNNLTEIKGPGIGYTKIGYEIKKVQYETVSAADWFLGIIPTAVDVTTHWVNRILVDQVITASSENDPLFLTTDYDYDFKYVGHNQFHNFQTTIDNGRTKNIYYYGKFEGSQFRYYNIWDYFVDWTRGVFQACVSRIIVHSYLTEMMIVDSVSEELLENTTYEWDLSTMRITKQRTFRGDDYFKEINIQYDYWGNPGYQKVEETANLRSSKTETWTVYNNSSHPGFSGPREVMYPNVTRDDDIAGTDIRNLPAKKLERTYIPDPENPDDITNYRDIVTEYAYNSMKKLESTIISADQILDSLNEAGDLESSYEYYSNDGSLTNGMIKTVTRPDGVSIGTAYFYLDDDTKDYYVVETTIEGVEQYDNDFTEKQTHVIRTYVAYEKITDWKIWEIDEAGLAKAWDYDGMSRPVAIYVPSDESDTFGSTDINQDIRDTIRTDSVHWLKTEISYDDTALTSTVTPPAGENASTLFKYNNAGRLTEIQKKNRKANSDMTELTDEFDTITTALTYNAYGEVASIIKPAVNGQSTAIQYEYDALGQVSKVTHPILSGESEAAFKTSQMNYEEGIHTATDEEGNSFLQYKDWKGETYRTSQVVDGLNVINDTWFDGAGNAVIQSMPAFETESDRYYINTDYNVMNKPIAVYNPEDTFYEVDSTDTWTSFLGTPFIKHLYNKAGVPVEEYLGYLRNDTETYILKKVYDVNALGQVLSTSYYPATEDGSGFVETASYSERTKYDLHGNVVAVQDGEQKITRSAYSDRGLLTSQEDSLSHTVQYTYDTNGNMSSMTDPRHDVSEGLDFQITYLYDDLKRLIAGHLPKTTTTDKPLVKLEYNDRNKLTRRTDPDNTYTNYEYNKRDQLKSETYSSTTNATEYTTYYEYDKIGNVSAQYKSESEKTYFEYNEAGKLSKTIYPLGNYEEVFYDARGNQKLLIDGEGNRTQFEYNSSGQVITRTDALTKSAMYYYDPAGNQTGYEDKNGNMYTYSYDAFSRLVGETDPFGKSRSYSYNNVGNVESITDPRGVIANYQYTDNHLVRTITYSGTKTHSIEYWYDEVGTIKAARDGSVYSFFNCHSSNDIETATFDEIIASYTPDPYDRTWSQITRIGSESTTEVQYNYDVMNRITGLVYPDAYPLVYDYDTLGQLNDAGEFVYGQNGITYDNQGRLDSITASNGITADYSYDANSRLSSLSYYKTGDQTDVLKGWTYEYDGANNLINKSGSIYRYDPVNRLVTGELKGLFEVDVMDAQPQKVGTATRDYSGEKALVFGPDELETIYLDAQSISIGVDLITDHYISRIFIDADQAEHRTADDQLDIFYTTDSDINWSMVDRNEWLLKQTEEGDYYILFRLPLKVNKVKVHCHYDERDSGNNPELSYAEIKNTVYSLVKVYYMEEYMLETYQYDNNGNRTEAEKQIGTDGSALELTSYSYYLTGQSGSEGSDRLKKDDTWLYMYDDAGNMTSKGTYTIENGEPEYDNVVYQAFEYDVLNRLVTVKDSEENSIAAYAYDYSGYRVKTESEKYGTSYYSFSGNGMLLYSTAVAEEGGEETARREIYVVNTHFARCEYDTSDSSSVEKYYYLTDHQGSTVMTTDDTGKILWQDDYTSFGESTGRTGFLEDDGKYTGKELDPDTGLFYSNARWYSAELGRFVTEDPIKDGLNWYAYCGSNPMNRIDPSGLVWYIENESYSSLGSTEFREQNYTDDRSTAEYIQKKEKFLKENERFIQAKQYLEDMNQLSRNGFSDENAKGYGKRKAKYNGNFPCFTQEFMMVFSIFSDLWDKPIETIMNDIEKSGNRYAIAAMIATSTGAMEDAGVPQDLWGSSVPGVLVFLNLSERVESYDFNELENIPNKIAAGRYYDKSNYQKLKNDESIPGTETFGHLFISYKYLKSSKPVDSINSVVKKILGSDQYSGKKQIQFWYADDEKLFEAGVKAVDLSGDRAVSIAVLNTKAEYRDFLFALKRLKKVFKHPENFPALIYNSQPHWKKKK